MLTQYKSHSLDRHIVARRGGCRRCWATTSRPSRRRCAAGRTGSRARPTPSTRTSTCSTTSGRTIVASSAPTTSTGWTRAQMVDAAHRDAARAVTVAALRAPLDQADQFGVIETARRARASRRSARSPTDAVGLPDAPDQVFASMGNYVFDAEALIDVVHAGRRGARVRARHGRQHRPGPGRRAAQAHVYDFSTQRGPGRDGARRRLLARRRDARRLLRRAHGPHLGHPIFNLYNREWPILTLPEPLPPAKFVFDEDGRRGQALDSMVCAGVVISGGDGAPLGPLAGRARALLRAGRGLRAVEGVEVGRQRRRAPGDPRQERRRRAGRADRRRPRGRPRALHRSARAASWSSPRARR